MGRHHLGCWELPFNCGMGEGPAGWYFPGVSTGALGLYWKGGLREVTRTRLSNASFVDFEKSSVLGRAFGTPATIELQRQYNADLLGRCDCDCSVRLFTHASIGFRYLS
jgi:hypothetical protein